MKKNFFKKLAFVMALAMIVSTIVPAAGAFAATTAKLNATAKVLQLGGDFDFNVVNKPAGCTFAWSSADEAVATVDKYGVATAEGLGDTTLTLTIKKSGKTVKKLTAKVYVRDNISELTELYLQTPAGADLTKLVVGKEYDFGRKFKTVSGSTTKTSGVTRWEVNATSDKATVNETTGLFVAKEAGKYTITARAFQSQAKYDAWKADKTLDVVTATKTLDVTVVVSLTNVKLVKPSQLQLTFDSSVKDVVKAAADVKVDLKLTGGYVAMVPVKSFDSISADGKVVTVSTYDNLVNEKTYAVTAAGSSLDLYAQIGTPVSISMEDQTLPAGTATKVAYTLLDQYGVNLSSVATFDAQVSKHSSIAFTAPNNGILNLGDGVVAFVEYSYTIINADGTTKDITTGTKTVKGAAATLGTTLEWNIDDAAGDHFATADKAIAAEEAGQFIYGRVKDSAGNYVTTYHFESLNTSVLFVNAANNALIALTEGTALLRVTDNNNVTVGYITVQVTSKSATTSLKASTNVVKLSNNIAGALVPEEHVDVTIKNVDQYLTETNATIDQANSYVANSTRSTDAAVISFPNAYTVRFTAVATKTGSFTYYVKAGDKALTISVTVAAPGLLSNYTISADQDSVDAYLGNGETPDGDVNFTVYGMDAAGYKKQVIVASGSAVPVTYTVTGPNDFSEPLTDDDADGTVAFTSDDASKPAVVAGTYTLTVKIGGISYAKTFTVANSRPTPSLSVEATNVSVTSGTSIVATIEELLELTYNDNNPATDDHVAITDVKIISGNTNIIASTTSGGVNGSYLTTGTFTVYVKSISYNATGITQSMDINKSFTVTVR